MSIWDQQATHPDEDADSEKDLGFPLGMFISPKFPLPHSMKIIRKKAPYDMEKIDGLQGQKLSPSYWVIIILFFF